MARSRPGKTTCTQKEHMMAKELKGQGTYYYYDFHPTEEDLMGETAVHRKLITYLVLVLERQFQAQVCTIHANLNFYLTGDALEYPLAPDVAVIKGVKLDDLSSWRVGVTGPVPQVVMEIASEKTW